MKRIAAIAVFLGLAICGWLCLPAGAQSNILRVAGLSSGGTISQTFNGVMSNPAAPTLSAGPTSGGSCRSDTTYEGAVIYTNVSGGTAIGTLSGTFQPSSGNTNKITFTRPTFPSNASTWEPVFYRSTDSFANARGCSSFGARSTGQTGTTFDCLCATTGGTITPPSNTTASLNNWNAIGTPGGVYVNRPLLTTLEVCSFGCQYSTVTSALAAITDASATKPYIIHIRSPFQAATSPDGTINPKSYVSIVGDTRAGVQLRAIRFNAAVTEVYLSRFSTTGVIDTTAYGGGTSNVYISDVQINQPGTTQIDGLYDPQGGWNWFMTDTVIYSAFDTLAFPSGNSKLYGSGNTYIIVGGEIISKCWNSLGGVGNQIYDNSFCDIALSGACGGFNGDTDQGAVTFGQQGSATSPSAKINLSGSIIRIVDTCSSGTGRVSCAYLAAAAGAGTTVPLDMSLEGVDCVVSGTGTLDHKGIMVGLSAGHNVWALQYIGGRIAVSGGASANAVDNAETASGFTLSLAGVMGATTFTGSGTSCPGANCTTFAADTGISKASVRAIIPAEADLVADTCTVGEIKPDSAGGTRELCWCYNNAGTGRWACVSATTANGPTN